MICNRCKKQFEPVIKSNTNTVICPHCYSENIYTEEKDDVTTESDISEHTVIFSNTSLLSEEYFTEEKTNIAEDKWEKIKCDKCKAINDSRRKSKFCQNCGWPLNKKYTPQKTAEQKLDDFKRKNEEKRKQVAKLNKKVNTMKFNTFYAIVLIIGAILSFSGGLLLYLTSQNILISSICSGMFSLIIGVLLLFRNKIGYVLTIIRSILMILLCGFIVICSVFMVYSVKTTQIEKVKFLYNQRAIILSCESSFDIDKEIANSLDKKNEVILKSIKSKDINGVRKELGINNFNLYPDNIQTAFKSLVNPEDISNKIQECKTPDELISLSRKLVSQYSNSIMKSTVALMVGIPSLILLVIHILIIIYYKRRISKK